MDELTKKLVDLRVKLQLTEKRYDESTDEAELTNLEKEITDIQAEITDVENQINEVNKEKEQPNSESNEEPKDEPTSVEEEMRKQGFTKVEPGNVTKVFSAEERGGDNMNENLEYRKKFMEAIQSRNLSGLEKRADQYTTTGDVEYVIPENLVNDIITKIEEIGMILPLVNKTNFVIGQKIPVGLTKINATWVGTVDNPSGEGLGSEIQKTGVEGFIVFNGHKLRCVAGMTHEAKIQSLSVFESKFVEAMANAIVRALETAIISGDGVNQPKGILLETPAEGQAIEIASGSDIGYAEIVKFVGACPERYENGAIILMAQNTFYDLMSITDQAGQPIARVNVGLNGRMDKTLLGRPVMFAGEYIAKYNKTVEADTTFAVMYNFSEYTLNTNYDLGVQNRINWDNDNHETKIVMAVDGKAVTVNSLVTWTVKPGAGA